MQTCALAVLALAGVAAAATSVVPPPYSQTCQINVPQPYNAAYACPSECQMSCNVYQYSAAQGSYVNKLSPTAINCGGVLMYNIEYYNFYNQLETGWVAAVYLDCSRPPPALASTNGDVQQTGPSANSGQEPQVAPQPEQQRRREATTTSRRMPPPYEPQLCQINVPYPYNSAYACPNQCQTSCDKYQYTAAQGSSVLKLYASPVYCGGVPYYYIQYYNYYNQLQQGYVAAVYLDCSAPPPALASANGNVQQTGPSANSGQEPQVAPQPDEQQRRREATTTSRSTPPPQLCQINVPYPYNSAYACPNQCESSCNVYLYTAAQGSSVLKINPAPIYCGGVPYYFIQYYNFYNQLKTGYVAAVYLDCSMPPPALSANGDAQETGPSANSGEEPQVAPQPEQQRRRDAEATTNTDKMAVESQQRQCKVPKTTYTYNLVTCEPQVQINGGSVVVDMGRDIVYSSKCGQTYLYVEYMLWGGEIGYGYVPYNALQC